MYRQFFGLHSLPFEDQPRPAVPFPGEGHAEALEFLEGAVTSGRRSALLTGAAGLGKTLVCRVALSSLPDGVLPVLGTCTEDNQAGLIQRVAQAIGLSIDQAATPDECTDLIRRHLADGDRRRQLLLVLDQAENLSPAELNEVNLLCDLRSGRARLTQVILVGRPELEESLERPELSRLRHRLTASHCMQPLSVDEVTGYVRHRMHLAGCANRELFGTEALALICRCTDGVPSRVNEICDAALRAAHRAGLETIDGSLVASLPEVAREQVADLYRGVRTEAISRASEQVEQMLTAGQGLAQRIEETVERASAELARVRQEVGDVSERLQTEVGVASQKSEQLASLIGGAREAANQSVSAMKDAHGAADLLLGKVADGQTAAEAVEHRLRIAVDDAGKSVQGIAHATAHARAMADTLRLDVSSSKQQAARLASLADAAREAARQAGEATTDAHRAADQTLGAVEKAQPAIEQIEGKTAAASSTAAELARMTEQAGEAIRTLEERCHHAASLDQQLAANQQAAAQVAESSVLKVADAQEATERITSALAKCDGVIARLAELTAGAEQTANQLAEQQDAARSLLEAKQAVRDSHQQLGEEFAERVQQAGELAASLSALNADGAKVGELLVAKCDRASRQTEQIDRRLEVIEAREQIMAESARTLQEFIQHAERISGQIETMQRHADECEARVNRLLERPEQVVTAAKTQTEQLQGICRAVRKVFAGLSQAAIEANKRIEQFRELSQTADERAGRRSAETARASEKLRTWVVEALRVQSRLAEALRQCQAVGPTGPPESLRNLVSLANRSSDIELGRLDEPQNETGLALPGAEAIRTVEATGDLAVARRRSEEIRRLLEDARRTAEVVA